MKKIRNILILCLVLSSALLTSCTKEKFYSITNNFEYGQETIIYEYNEEDEPINVHPETLNAYENNIFTCSNDVVKIKIFVSGYHIDGFFLDSGNWIQQVFYLEKNKNTNIVLDGSTIVGPERP